MLEFLKTIKSNDDFSEGWQKYRSQATIEDLRYVIPEGEHKGKTGLWFLANEADEDCVNDLMGFISGKKLTLEDLLIEAVQGADKGKSVLWLLAELTIQNITQPFMAIWEQFKSVLTVNHFLNRKSGCVLAQLIDGMRMDVATPFNAVWEQFKDQISLDQLLNRGNHLFSLFWSLALVAEKFPEPFVWILNRHSAAITLSDLLEKKAGKSVLWIAAEIVTYGKAEPFSIIWRLHKENLKLAHFLEEVDDSENLGESTLFVLAFAALVYPGSFITVWNHFKQQITLKDLLGVAKEGEVKGKSTLNLIEEAAKRFPQVKSLLREFIKRSNSLLKSFERSKDEAIFLKPFKVERKKVESPTSIKIS